MDGYELIAGRDGWNIYRKIENGRGLWKACRYEETEDKAIPITYEQALGYEPIEFTLGHFLGKMLLPK